MAGADYSIGEIGALVLKAYRGTGMPWGLAEEAGQAASWMVMHRLPGVEAFAGLLTALDGVAPGQRSPAGFTSPLLAVGGLLCPVATGAALCDFYAARTDWDGIILGAVAYPVILLPFADRLAASAQRRVSIQWGNTTVRSNGDGVVVDGGSSGLVVDRVGQLTLTVDDIAGKPGIGVSRRGVGQRNAIATLESFAHRTYVPASDASRLAGAGAGLNDND